MSGSKTVGCCFGAIGILVLSQIFAQLVGSIFAIANVPAGVCNIIAGVLYLLFAYTLIRLFSKKVLKTGMEALGMPKFRIKRKWIIAAILLPAAVKAIYFLFPGEFVSSNMDETQMFTTLSAGIVFSGVAAGFVEEIVFRGVILNLIKEKWNTPAAILVPSVLFGAVHIIGMNFSVLSCLTVIAAGTMVGIMFSLIELESQSVWNSGIVHALWNIVIIGGGLSIGETADPYSIMTYVLETDNFAFTGGEFGIESSVIAVVGYAAVALAAFWAIRHRDTLMKSSAAEAESSGSTFQL